jgi:hypothetical protein
VVCSSLGGNKALVYSCCQFPWSKYSSITSFKLPTCCCWEEMVPISVPEPVWANSDNTAPTMRTAAFSEVHFDHLGALCSHQRGHFAGRSMAKLR